MSSKLLELAGFSPHGDDFTVDIGGVKTSVRDLFAPVPRYWAHRGASYQAPENSQAAWDLAAAAGFALEGDFRVSSDGQLVVMHDATVDRTTTSAGNVSAYTLAQLRAMDNGSKFHPNFATERIPSGAALLARYPKAWLVPENSIPTVAAGLRLAAAIERAGALDRAIVQQFEGSPYPVLSAIKAAYPRLQTCMLINTGGPAPNLVTAAAAGITWIGPDISDAATWLTAAWVAAAQAAGFKIVPYTIDSLAQKATAEALGVDAMFTGRPFLIRRGLAAPAPLRESWSGYMFGDDWYSDNLALTTAVMPRVYDGYIELASTALLNIGVVCIGRPLPPAATSYQLNWSVTPKVMNADNTRWSALQFALQQDNLVRTFGPVPAGFNGYHALLRQNGTIELTKFVAGANSVTMGTTAGAATVLDTPVPLQLNVTPAQITFQRLDTGASVVVNDAAFRGGKAGIIWSNTGARYGPIDGQ